MPCVALFRASKLSSILPRDTCRPSWFKDLVASSTHLSSPLLLRVIVAVAVAVAVVVAAAAAAVFRSCELWLWLWW